MTRNARSLDLNRDADLDKNNKRFYAPLFTIDEVRNQPVTSFCTATFVNIGTDFFLVTPAHSLFGLNGLPALIGLSKFHDLAGFAVATDKEFADLAAIKLPDRLVVDIADEVLFVTEDLISRSGTNSMFYAVYGFPANKNKQKKSSDRFIKPHVLNVTSQEDVSATFFPSEGYSELVHFALEYDEKNLLNDDGKKIQEHSLAGASGGIVVEYFDPLDFRIAGIFLARKKKEKALVCLKYEYIFHWLKNVNFLG